MSLTVSGLISGIDVDSIVEQLAEVEREPITKLEAKEADYNVKLTAYGNLSGAVDSLNSAIKELNTTNDFKAFTASSADDSLATATANASATPGSYNLTVQQLAQVHKMTSGGFTANELMGAGTLTMQVGNAEAVDIEVSAEDTLSDVAKAINEADAGVKARVIYDGSDYFLTLAGEDTGENNTISLTATDEDADPDTGLSRLVEGTGSQQLTETQAAQDAMITVDGVTDIKRSSNTIDDVISGVTLDLASAPGEPDNTITLTISRDLDAISGKIDEMVSAYNKVVDFFETYQKYDQATETTGDLFGDTTTNMIRSKISNLFSDSVSGNENFSRLSDLGITLDDEGYLQVDESELNDALTQHYDDVVSFFTNSEEGAEGFSVRANTVLNAITETGSGIISSRKNGIQSSIDTITDQKESIEKRVETSEARTRAQFASLEILLAEYQSTSDYLSQQIESWQAS